MTLLEPASLFTFNVTLLIYSGKDLVWGIISEIVTFGL